MTLKLDNYNNDLNYELKRFNFSDEILAKIKIESKVFLEKVGLPKIDFFDALKFNPYFEDTNMITNEDESFLIIGNLFYSDKFLQVYFNLNNQNILIDDPNTSEEVLFANSEIFAFKAFLDTYANQIIKYINMEESEIIEQDPINWLESKLTILDAEALQDQNNFWNIFLFWMKSSLQ